MELPLILAGPILRRVEPRLVSVWVATSMPCGVKLSIRKGFVKAGEGDSVIDSPEPARTIRIGKQLHIVVASVKIPLPQLPLLPEQIYSYDVLLESPSGATDLKKLGLLQDGIINGKSHLALGYDTDLLPNFVLPPMDLGDLKLLHGSCRKPNKDVPDGLAWVDDFIKDSRLDPRERPHQLFLTGDQIYADDVDQSMLRMVNDLSMILIGSRHDNTLEEDIPFEHLPINKALNDNHGGIERFPSDRIHFPPGYRLSLTQNEAMLTSVDGQSHLLSFGEFCTMYLFVWSNACWPEVLPTEEQLLEQLFSFSWIGLMPDNLQGRILGPVEKVELPLFYRLGEITATAMENILGTGQDLPKLFTVSEKEDALNNLKKGMAGELRALKQLQLALPKVRRALANVPTYMMFDDHEVTDDWNLNPMWRDRVFTSPLGKTIIRNGMLAYALFQGWGNDPVKFETGDYKKLLELAAKLFEKEGDGPDETAGTVIDTLLGLDTNNAPPIKWHYCVDGAKHRVIALDNRTRRSFFTRIGPPGNISLEAMAEQIPAGPLPAGLEVLVVIAPLPVLGPPVLDELVAPLVYRIFDLKSRNDLEKTAGSRGMPGTNPDAIEAWAFDPLIFEALLKRLEPYRRVVLLSGDVHYASTQVMSYWKKDDSEPARFAQFTSSGFRNTQLWYIRFVDRSFALAQQIVRANIATERLGWEERTPDSLQLPPNAKTAAALRSKLRHEPVLIPTEGWPEGTATTRPPDWQWRVGVLRDARPDSARPEEAQPEALRPGDPTADILLNLEGYRRVAIRQAKQLDNLSNSRQFLFANNLGVVRFAKRVETVNGQQIEIIDAIHELYAAYPYEGVEELEASKPFTVHIVPLSSPGEKKPENTLNSGDGE